MRIVHIIPGSGGSFYCQNCIRDFGLLKAMSAAGHDVMFMPLYLPPMEAIPPEDVEQAPVFYGAVNVYLDQKLGIHRRLPGSVRRWLDAGPLLRWAGGRAGTTQANGLGELTLSVLQGKDGRQNRALDEMLSWLKTQPKPDVVHISNSLLLGLVPALKAALDVPVACSLQDEDTWLDELEAPYPERCWEAIRNRSRDVNLFLPVSAYYAERVQAQLGLPASKCTTVPVGVDVDAYEPLAPPPERPVLGFLSEWSHPFGLDILVEAFLQLRERAGLEDLRLRIAGGTPQVQTPFVKQLRRRIDASQHARAIEFLDAHRQPARGDFLKSLRVLSVPARRPEAFGLFQLEAMACGVPVVQPRLGAYPEIIAATGGGVLYDDPSPGGLANALYPLLTNPETAARYGSTGRQAVLDRFTVRATAERILSAYETIRGDGVPA